MPFLKTGKTNWKHILIVAILAILVGGGILGWIKKDEISPPELLKIEKPEKVVKDETADWKTYRNEKYGFEFKYPPSLTIGGNDEEILGSYGGHSVEVLMRIVSSQPAFHKSWTGLISRPRSIGQINAIEYYSSPNDEVPEFVYILLPNQKYIEISAEINFPDAAKNFNQMLSTFRFLK